MSWIDALTFANSLYDGWTGDPSSSDCGLSDGSTAGDWRLPSVNELERLIDAGYAGPALSNAAGDARWKEGDAFSGVQADVYWSSTSNAGNTSYAWYVYLSIGFVGTNGKTSSYYVWPVRGGQ